MIYMGLEIGLDVLEKFWKSFGNALIKMCGNPVFIISDLSSSCKVAYTYSQLQVAFVYGLFSDV